MTKLKVENIEVPPLMIEGWQTIVDLLAQLTNVPSALIMKVSDQEIEVFTSNNNLKSPYSAGDKETLGRGLYCETVISTSQKLVVPNALTDKEWENNPDIDLGMIAYCGLPIRWPKGESFGTLCILDSKENTFIQTYQDLLTSFQCSIEAQLCTLFQNETLKLNNSDLLSRVASRTKDLAKLNYSLSIEIDKRKAAEEEIYYQQSHDLGTGFLNRYAFEVETKRLIEQNKNLNTTIYVIYIGFTNGRRIQNKLGHHALDELLKNYRKRLGVINAINSITARPTSIDLSLAIQTTSSDNAIEPTLQKLLEIGHADFEYNGQIIHLNSYIGISHSDSHNYDEEVIDHASEAMLACKDSGHKFSYYARSLSLNQTRLNQMESYLLQAVRNDELILYFQPKVSPSTGQWVGSEALLRWDHPLLGHVSNESLIQLAEQNGLIFELGNFVLRAAIEQASSWAKYMPDFKMAVNISSVQLKNPQLATQIISLLKTYHLPAKVLELEITESGLIADEYLAGNTLKILHEHGVTLSLDDFGTGYASFSYLKKYPFDCIKIDRSFLNQIEIGTQDKEIVRSIIHVAKKLKLEVVMEGIENAAQEQFILEEGCDIGQGYFYGKPMPCHEFESHLVNQSYFTN